MGGAVSAGADNNDLVDKLVTADFIKTAQVERVFRAVDRGMYFTESDRDIAYKDFAWKCGNLHLSAPCVYSEVMENLSLGPGMSFLNLGSGTGYLSTMVGLILGSYGTNHGVEIHHDVVQYAQKKLEEFKRTSAALEEYDFCEPKFVQGNCLKLAESSIKYDRVYCGAACPPSYEGYMKNLIKVGGVLVVPLNDKLLRITRLSETTWENKSQLPVAFANLLEPIDSPMVLLPNVEPITLMEACRSKIRAILLSAFAKEHPELKSQSASKSKPKERKTISRILLSTNNGLAIITGPSRMTSEWVLDSDEDDSESSNADLQQGDESGTTSSGNCNPRAQRPQSALCTVLAGNPQLLLSNGNPLPAMDFEVMSTDSKKSDNDSDSDSMELDPLSEQSKKRSTEGTEKRVRNKRKEAEMEECEDHDKASASECTQSSPQRIVFSSSDDNNQQATDNDNVAENSSKKGGAKREKVDSGIGEEISNLDVSFPVVHSPRLDCDSMNNDESWKPQWTNFALMQDQKCKDSSSYADKKVTEISYMRLKIKQLPLPSSLKSYLNYHRDL